MPSPRAPLFRITLSICLLALAPGGARAHFCWGYSSLPADNPLPWDDSCDSLNNLHPANSTAGQSIRDEHRNWHCNNPVQATDAYGRAFLAFHRQFILDFNNWRLEFLPLAGRLETWDPFEDAQVPGNDETTGSAFTWCSECLPDECANNSPHRRGAGAVCAGCSDLPAAYIGSGLDNFNSLGHLGWSLDFNWHGSYHGGVSAISPGCADIGTTTNTSRDPAFWMAHNKLDEVARDWQLRRAADVVIVLDRSGSMDDNCSSTTPPSTESPCAINDARTAAGAFADLVLDVRMDGGVPAAQQHRLALVSYSSSHQNHLGPTPAQGIVTDNDADDTPFEIALAGITSGGLTSIGAGIREAIAILTGLADPNPHQAILVLTDGKENTAPCLEGQQSPCLSPDVITSAELGNIQVVAIGLGAGVEEDALRDVAERHGGVFVAQQNLVDPSDDLDPQKLLKFFVTAFSQIFDEAPAQDPEGTMVPGQQASAPFDLQICGADERLAVFLGRDRARDRRCDLRLELTSPAGDVVSRGATGVEAGHGPMHDFLRVDLPHQGAAAGTWKARVVRAQDYDRECGEQDYFYATLVKGLGRVTPFVIRPRVVAGTRLLASFRMTHSNRPIGDWDRVEAHVTVTGPDGQSARFPLHDDGTHGDRIIGNNVWTAEMPEPAKQPGAYHMRGHFELTKDGCTRIRESEYAVIVEPEPERCAKLVCAGTVGAHPGEVRTLAEMACVHNICGPDVEFELQVSDTQGWLHSLDADGNPIELPADGVFSGVASTGQTTCFNHGLDPLVAVIPEDATPGTTSTAVSVLRHLGRDTEPSTCTTVLRAARPPDCNDNRIDDREDIASGHSADANRNSVPDECDSIGACCTERGCMIDMTEARCRAMKGEWHRARTCTEVRCPVGAPTGACCTSEGECIDDTGERVCKERYYGRSFLGSSCDQVDCSRKGWSGAPGSRP